MVENKDLKTSTVFIRGLKPNTKDANLSEVFKDFGVIRQAFVTKPKFNKDGGCLGYVKFTKIEEASSAINSVKMIGGKKVILSFARKKPRKFRQSGKADRLGTVKKSGLSDTDDETVDEIVCNQTNEVKLDKPTEVTEVKHLSPSDKETKTKKHGHSPTLIESPVKDVKTVIVFNLADGITENAVRKRFRKIGEIEKIVLADSKASITFKEEDSAKAAVKKLNNHIFKQNVITVVPSSLSEKALKRMALPVRLIVRNISFKVTEELLHAEFSSIGKINGLSLPITGDGKMKGFAFVSFSNKFQANRAIQKLNGKEILGRKIAVDWAVAKDQYSKNLQQKQPNDNEATLEDAEGNLDENENDDESVKDDALNEDIADEDKESSDDGEEDGDKPVTEDVENNPEHLKKSYDDIKEGRTIFLRNLPYDVEKEEIEEAFSSFGAVRYVRMLFDHEKNRPKGTAFLQFKEKSGADECLRSTQNEPVTLEGRSIIVSSAIENTESLNNELTGKKGKDNRNLHLASEGVIKEGTNAAIGVSKSDMLKRKLAFEAKKKKLKNVNVFISTVRLCVRNMPSTFSETDLKNMMSKYGKVVQIKILRDIKQSNSEGVGKSKGYGFVQFSKHEAALAALRAVNNNPNIFSSSKRPIVDFSLEDQNKVNARIKKVSKTESSTTKQKKSFNQRWKENRQKRNEKTKGEKQTKISSEKVDSVQKEAVAESKAKKSKKLKKQKHKNSDLKDTNVEFAAKPDSHENGKGKRRGTKLKDDQPKKKSKQAKDASADNALQTKINQYKDSMTSNNHSKSFKKWYE